MQGHSFGTALFCSAFVERVGSHASARDHAPTSFIAFIAFSNPRILMTRLKL